MQLHLFSFSAQGPESQKPVPVRSQGGNTGDKDSVTQSLYSEMGYLCIPVWPCVWEVRLSKVRSQMPLPTPSASTSLMDEGAAHRGRVCLWAGRVQQAD